MTGMPDVVVEIAFDTPPDDPSPVWEDVSDYVEAHNPASMTRGRSDELTEVQASRLTVTLDNTDGRFTPANAASPYYPNVKKNRMIRVTAEHPPGGSPTVYRRFTGYIDEWPVAWPGGTDTNSQVTVTASSRRARLAAAGDLPSIIEREILKDGPAAYYPMGEPQPKAGSDGKAGDVSGNQMPNLAATGSNPAIQWQAATGPGTDSLSAPVFSAGRFLRMDAKQAFIKSSHTSFTYSAFISTTDTAGQTVMTIGLQANPTWIAFTMDTDGTIFANTFGVGATSLHSTSSLNDGETHHIAYRETISGGTVTQTLYVDGDAEDTDTYSESQFNQRFIVKVGEGYEGSISHVAIFSGTTQLSDARVASHAASGLTGFEGDSSDARIERLAEYADIPASTISTETGMSTSLGAQDTTGRTALTLMQEVTDTEGGILFDTTDGILTFHARSHRYNAASTFTLDAALQQIQSSIEAKMDGQQLVNDLTATGATGLSIRVTNAASILEHMVHRSQFDSLTTNDDELLDSANWRVNRYGEPDVRVHAVTVDLVNQDDTLVDLLLSAELGDRITLDNLPDQAPAASMDMFIEGINESIGVNSYDITFELSPVTLWDVWQLNSTLFSQLDETTVLAY